MLLADARKRVTVLATAPFTIRDALGNTHILPARTLTLGPRLIVALEDGTRGLPGPLVLRAGPGSTLRLDGKPYRGELEVRRTCGAWRSSTGWAWRPTCKASFPARCRATGPRRR